MMSKMKKAPKELKMKKSHMWNKRVLVRCPYCGEYQTHTLFLIHEGNVIKCKECSKQFQLGKQK